MTTPWPDREDLPEPPSWDVPGAAEVVHVMQVADSDEGPGDEGVRDGSTPRPGSGTPGTTAG